VIILKIFALNGAFRIIDNSRALTEETLEQSLLSGCSISRRYFQNTR